MKLTQEQLAALIARVFANLIAAGKDPASIGTEDILSELAIVLDSAGEGGSSDTGEEDGSKAEGGKGEDDGGAVPPELIAKIVDALKSLKTEENAGGSESKAAADAGGSEGKTAPATAPAAPVQRKYSNLFLASGSARDAAPANAFKARMEQLSVPERRKAAYGMFGRAVKCIHTSGGDIEKAAFAAERKFQDAEMAREFKALSATVPGDGGYLVPEVYANEIIELLYPATVIYSLGARRLGMANGNLNIPKIKTGSRAMFTGENRATPRTAPKFGNLKLSAKKLTALIAMSNDLLRSTNFDNDVIVGQDVTRQMALGVDHGAFLGTGDEFQPLGILLNKAVRNVDVTKLGTEYAGADGKLTAMFPNFIVASVLKNNVYADGLGFVFNTSVEQYFKSIRDNVGGFIFAEEMSKGTLVGYPYKTTNLLPTSDKGRTRIIFGNWNDLMIGEQGALEIETSREGSWTDDYGNLISAFENDQTLIRAINHVDTGLRHEESFIVATEVAVPV